MSTTPKTLKQRLEHFKTVCRESGMKLTHQRMEVFQELAKTGDHPDAEKIYSRVRQRLPMISLDTVYRTLWMLKDLGLIRTLAEHHDRTRFDANLDHHHHFVCTHCGLTCDFYCDSLDTLTLPESIHAIGSVESAQVEVRGICLKCKKKIEEDSNKFNSKGGNS